MSVPNFVILYVDSPTASAAFYADLLARPAIDASPTFAMFQLHPDVMLGLWAKHAVEPAAVVTGGGGELAFSVDGNAAVDVLHADWSRRGLAMLQAPVELDFGYTFVARDPDGHRLRVYAPKPQ
ncbi:glyoxalase-like domain protein [mine drainage metagenome]|uniref:Glyoxalase-like domain protein n=1 Tax=mine drainage metagenome TaxID=410659 RepID=A0A1J5PFJ5_9ZZZZ